jgi:hypothetical protein
VTCTALQKVDRGCDEPVKGPYVISIAGVEQRRCPRRPILDDPELYSSLFWLYRNAQRGIMVEPGGLQDQPHALTRAFKEIDVAKAHVDKAKEESDARKRRRTAKAGSKRAGARPRR